MATTWRRAFLVLITLVLVGGPLFAVEIYAGTRGTPELPARWVELARRCQVAVESRKPFDGSDLTERTDHGETYWVDDRYQLSVNVTGFGDGKWLGCQVGRIWGLPVADIRMAEILLAYTELRNDSLMSGKYVDWEPGPLAGSPTLGFESANADSSGCLIRSYLLLEQDDHGVKWAVGAVPASDQATCN